MCNCEITQNIQLTNNAYTELSRYKDAQLKSNVSSRFSTPTHYINVHTGRVSFRHPNLQIFEGKENITRLFP